MRIQDAALALLVVGLSKKRCLDTTLALLSTDASYFIPVFHKVVEKCGITYSMLSTPEAASDVFYDPKEGVLSGLSKGKSLVDCATLQVEVSNQAHRAISPLSPKS